MELLEEIIKTYGKVDYYEMQTGKIYHLSQMAYSLYKDVTRIPVSRDGELIGCIELKGDQTR